MGVAGAIRRCFDRSHNDHYEAIAAFPVRLYRLLHNRSWIFDLSVARGCPLDGGLKLRGERTALAGLESAECRPPADPKFAIVSPARRAASANYPGRAPSWLAHRTRRHDSEVTTVRFVSHMLLPRQTLKAVGDAFDQARTEIACNFGNTERGSQKRCCRSPPRVVRTWRR